MCVLRERVALPEPAKVLNTFQTGTTISVTFPLSKKE